MDQFELKLFSGYNGPPPPVRIQQLQQAYGNDSVCSNSQQYSRCGQQASSFAATNSLPSRGASMSSTFKDPARGSSYTDNPTVSYSSRVSDNAAQRHQQQHADGCVSAQWSSTTQPGGEQQQQPTWLQPYQASIQPQQHQQLQGAEDWASKASAANTQHPTPPWLQPDKQQQQQQQQQQQKQAFSRLPFPFEPQRPLQVCSSPPPQLHAASPPPPLFQQQRHPSGQPQQHTPTHCLQHQQHQGPAKSYSQLQYTDLGYGSPDWKTIEVPGGAGTTTYGPHPYRGVDLSLPFQGSYSKAFAGKSQHSNVAFTGGGLASQEPAFGPPGVKQVGNRCALTSHLEASEAAGLTSKTVERYVASKLILQEHNNRGTLVASETGMTIPGEGGPLRSRAGLALAGERAFGHLSFGNGALSNVGPESGYPAVHSPFAGRKQASSLTVGPDGIHAAGGDVCVPGRPHGERRHVSSISTVQAGPTGSSGGGTGPSPPARHAGKSQASSLTAGPGGMTIVPQSMLRLPAAPAGLALPPLSNAPLSCCGHATGSGGASKGEFSHTRQALVPERYGEQARHASDTYSMLQSAASLVRDASGGMPPPTFW